MLISSCYYKSVFQGNETDPVFSLGCCLYCEGSEEAVMWKGVKYNLKWKEKISIKTPKDSLGFVTPKQKESWVLCFNTPWLK